MLVDCFADLWMVKYLWYSLVLSQIRSSAIQVYWLQFIICQVIGKAINKHRTFLTSSNVWILVSHLAHHCGSCSRFMATLFIFIFSAQHFFYVMYVFFRFLCCIFSLIHNIGCNILDHELLSCSWHQPFLVGIIFICVGSLLFFLFCWFLTFTFLIYFISFSCPCLFAFAVIWLCTWCFAFNWEVCDFCQGRRNGSQVREQQHHPSAPGDSHAGCKHHARHFAHGGQQRQGRAREGRIFSFIFSDVSWRQGTVTVLCSSHFSVSMMSSVNRLLCHAYLHISAAVIHTYIYIYMYMCVYLLRHIYIYI